MSNWNIRRVPILVNWSKRDTIDIDLFNAPLSDVLSFLDRAHERKHLQSTQTICQDNGAILTGWIHVGNNAIASTEGLSCCYGHHGQIVNRWLTIVQCHLDLPTWPERNGCNAEISVLLWTLDPFCSTEFRSTDGRCDTSIGLEEHPANGSTIVLGFSIPSVGWRTRITIERGCCNTFESPSSTTSIYAFHENVQCCVEIVTRNSMSNATIVS